MGEDFRTDTVLGHAGRAPAQHGGTVNTPVYRASTILFPTLADLDAKEGRRLRYGRRGTPTTHALEDAICELEAADSALVAPSGVSALTTVLMTYAAPGAHLLVADNAYGPVRKFCDQVLSTFGVRVSYYDPTIGPGIGDLIEEATRLIWMESPGSQTFEVQDVDSIVAAAQARGVVTVIDNTWSGGYFFQPLARGVDISVQAATKYISGHSDLMMGTIACKAEQYAALRKTYLSFGICTSSDDAFLALRGLRTLAVRMRQHHAAGLFVGQWLRSQPEVVSVMHPGLEGDRFHELWKRQFSGASGLFGFVITETRRSALARMLDGFRLFGMGSSWGGFESLMTPTDPAALRTATTWQPAGQTMRIHVGLEDPQDLVDEIRAGFDRMAAAD